MGCLTDAGLALVYVSSVNLSQPASEETPPSRAPKTVLVLMVVIIVAVALTALHANARRWRRSKIETVTITPASSLPVSGNGESRETEVQ